MTLFSAGLKRNQTWTGFECPAFFGLEAKFCVICALSSLTMIGVNSLHSAGRLRSRSLCTVRYGRDFRMMDPFRYPRTPRSRSLKPLVFPDLLGKAQDGQNHPQARKRRKVLKSVFCFSHFHKSVGHIVCHQLVSSSSETRDESCFPALFQITMTLITTPVTRSVRWSV